MFRRIAILALTGIVTSAVSFGLTLTTAQPASAQQQWSSAQWYAQHPQCGDRDKDDKACMKAWKRDRKAWQKQHKAWEKQQKAFRKDRDHDDKR